MTGEIFLWGGLVLSTLWHLVSWGLWTLQVPLEHDQMGSVVVYQCLVVISIGLSGVSLCAFGYLLF